MWSPPTIYYWPFVTMPVTILHCYRHLLDNARIPITQCCLSLSDCIVSRRDSRDITATPQSVTHCLLVVRCHVFCLSNSVVTHAQAHHYCHTHWLIFCGHSHEQTGCSFSCGVQSFPVVVHIVHGCLMMFVLKLIVRWPTFHLLLVFTVVVQLLAQSLHCSLFMVVCCCLCSLVARCQYRSLDHIIDPGVTTGFLHFGHVLPSDLVPAALLASRFPLTSCAH